MSVTQISRIQNRRGLESELPIQLAEGEIGFATDTGSVFIGAPQALYVSNRTEFPFQNVRLLNEFDLIQILSKLVDTPSYQNDGAAAAGGVLVGGVYRNGSALMVRVN